MKKGEDYIQSFSTVSLRPLYRAIEILKDSVSGIIIDLRGNGGGSLRSVINIADMFMRKNIKTRV